MTTTLTDILLTFLTFEEAKTYAADKHCPIAPIISTLMMKRRNEIASFLNDNKLTTDSGIIAIVDENIIQMESKVASFLRTISDLTSEEYVGYCNLLRGLHH